LINVNKVGLVQVSVDGSDLNDISNSAYICDLGLVEFCDSPNSWSTSKSYSIQDYFRPYAFNKKFPLIYFNTWLYPKMNFKYLIEVYDTATPASEASDELLPESYNFNFSFVSDTLNIPSGSTINFYPSSASPEIVSIDTGTNDFLYSSNGYPGFNFANLDSAIFAHIFTISLSASPSSYILLHTSSDSKKPPTNAFFINYTSGSPSTVKFGFHSNTVKYMTSDIQLKQKEILIVSTQDYTRVYLRCENNDYIPDGGYFLYPHPTIGISVAKGKAEFNKRSLFQSSSSYGVRIIDCEIGNVYQVPVVNQTPGYFAPIQIEKIEENKYKVFALKYIQSPPNLQLIKYYVNKEGSFRDEIEVIIDANTAGYASEWLSKYPLTGLRKREFNTSLVNGMAGGKVIAETDNQICGVLLFGSFPEPPEYHQSGFLENFQAYYYYFILDKQTQQLNIRQITLSPDPYIHLYNPGSKITVLDTGEAIINIYGWMGLP